MDCAGSSLIAMTHNLRTGRGVARRCAAAGASTLSGYGQHRGAIPTGRSYPTAGSVARSRHHAAGAIGIAAPRI